MSAPGRPSGVTEAATASGAPARRRGRLASGLALLAVLALAAVLHAPALSLGFVSDDFQWWHHARQAIDAPRLLLAPFGGYRPALTWLLALEHLAFGTSPAGYHAVGLGLHLLCGALLWHLLLRLFPDTLEVPARAFLVALWLLSPLALEPVQSVVSVTYSIMLACWLGMALVWPGPGRSWGPGRAVAALLLVALSVFTLETWVILPGLVAALELTIRRSTLRAALGASAVAAVPVAVYLAAYFSAPPVVAESYYSAGPAGIAKLPHIWASFAGLTTLQPVGIPFTWREVAALLGVAALAWLGLRSQGHAALLGLTLLVLPMLPLVAIGFVTSRYTAAPFAGFLVVVASGAVAASSRLARRWRLAGGLALASLGLLVGSGGWLEVRAQTSDRQRLERLTRGLLGEAAAVAPELPTHAPLVAVRRERVNPLADLVRTGSSTMTCLYVRGEDPYGLADIAALFSFVCDPLGGPLFTYARPAAGDESGYRVVVHDIGRFAMLEPEGRLAATVARWRAIGAGVKVLYPVPRRYDRRR